jgi:hypothetical protein
MTREIDRIKLQTLPAPLVSLRNWLTMFAGLMRDRA